MIKSFADKETGKLYITGKVRTLPASVCAVAIRKLDYLAATVTIKDLRVPPGNRLKALKGRLKGKYSIRINDQYRIIFTFKDADAYDVQVTDYH